MKIGGVEASSSWEPDPLILERGRDEKGNKVFLVFRARGLRDLDQFKAMCPKPENKSGMLTKDGWVLDPEGPEYLDQLRQWQKLKMAYIFIKTLEPSNIEWQKVQFGNPRTWLQYEDELKSILSYVEMSHLIELVEQANALNSAKLEENRQTFFQMRDQRLQQLKPDGQSGDPAST